MRLDLDERDVEPCGDIARHLPLRIRVRGAPANRGQHSIFAELLAQHHRQEGRIHSAGIPKQDRGVSANEGDRKSTRLNSSHLVISYAVFCLKKKKTNKKTTV